MSISRCSSIVLTVNGRVGLVLEGRTLGRPAILMMSGACPPPAPSVWNCGWGAVADRRDRVVDKSALVQGSVWMAIWMSNSSATFKLVSMTSSVVPQSSWSFKPQAPASI